MSLKMKSMNVVCKTQDIRLNHAWFDAERGYLHVEIDGVDRSIPFALIPDADFESSTPVCSFHIGMNGSVVVCTHQDGVETWLPADLWLADGFTPQE
jgi:hypothetical protein